MIHLRIAYANLERVLASTILNPLAAADILNDWRTDLSDANEPIKLTNSNYQSDPARDTVSSECDSPVDTARQEPKTQDFKDNGYPVAAEQEDYPGAGKANREVE